MKSQIKTTRMEEVLVCGITKTNIHHLLLRYFVGIMSNGHKIISVHGAPS